MKILEALHDSYHSQISAWHATGRLKDYTTLMFILSELVCLYAFVVLIEGTPHVRVC